MFNVSRSNILFRFCISQYV